MARNSFFLPAHPRRPDIATLEEGMLLESLEDSGRSLCVLTPGSSMAVVPGPHKRGGTLSCLVVWPSVEEGS